MFRRRSATDLRRHCNANLEDKDNFEPPMYIGGKTKYKDDADPFKNETEPVCPPEFICINASVPMTYDENVPEPLTQSTIKTERRMDGIMDINAVTSLREPLPRSSRSVSTTQMVLMPNRSHGQGRRAVRCHEEEGGAARYPQRSHTRSSSFSAFDLSSYHHRTSSPTRIHKHRVTEPLRTSTEQSTTGSLDLSDCTKSSLNILPARFVSGLYPPKMEAEIARKMKEIAIQKTQDGFFEESHNCLQRVLEVQRANSLVDRLEISSTMHHLGVALSGMGQNESALSVLQDALRLRRKWFKKDDLEVASTLFVVAKIHANNGDYEYAIRDLRTVQKIEKRVLGREVEFTSRLLKDLGAP